MATNLFFAYGTLQLPENTYAKFLNNHSKFVGFGKLSGELFDLGNYPGITIINDSANIVRGSVYELDNVEFVFKTLDEYEGITNKETDEYRREICKISINNIEYECWVYMYIQPTENKIKIPSGDYLQYLETKEDK